MLECIQVSKLLYEGEVVKAIRNYEELVYAGVLGKVIGVYLGRPFEGWTKEKLEARWGRIDRYVHEDLGKPLVVADDDISGTLTFIRALEDSGLYADTPEEFFGQTWLNYLIENQTVLWWGGLGVSTEHTAYLRLKHGIPAPESGSLAQNGPVVANQIGAQIFIDAFGLVAPGRPELAAELARRSARVSHDDEAVNGALVVAAMVSAAFVEKDMDRLLDIGVSVIPVDSLIARVHKDVRAWAKRDRDWRKTYDRIHATYGYSRYGGGCHMIPNHALLVLAWVYAPDDFHLAQVIVNTAGWDTDCNAANVGSVMGVKLGLAGINRQYDFQSPFADRILLPTAEGTRGATDVLLEAGHIARIGRKVMNWPELEAPKGGAWQHFEMPGALHGYQSEEDKFESRGAIQIENVAGHSDQGKRSLRLAYADLSAGRVARASTPLLPPLGQGGGYALAGTPRLYPGQAVTAKGVAGTGGPATARLYVRYFDPAAKATPGVVYGESAELRSGRPFTLGLTLPDLPGPALSLGLEVRGENRATGELFVDSVDYAGAPRLDFDTQLPLTETNQPVGFISDLSFFRPQGQAFSLGKNEGRGVLVTGTTDWTDYVWEAALNVKLADQAGLIVRYQGLCRYLALVKRGEQLQLVLNHYGEQVLAETKLKWRADEFIPFMLELKGKKLRAYCDGREVLSGEDPVLGRGGVGLMVENGTMAACRLKLGGVTRKAR